MQINKKKFANMFDRHISNHALYFKFIFFYTLLKIYSIVMNIGVTSASLHTIPIATIAYRNIIRVQNCGKIIDRFRWPLVRVFPVTYIFIEGIKLDSIVSSCRRER